MNFKTVLSKTCEDGDVLLQNVGNIIEAEAYCAQLQVYRTYLQQNREKADLYYENFREFNDKIFNQVIRVLDAAIDTANTELAAAAMETIRIMKSTYPDFYSSYCHQLFGR